ncbi:related to potential drug facilitator PEP5 [Phialocephala subalpina]|uniref:Related to potential drug facilitator PEP5 n=1 Tax=Phialocephala subalpina TaxID=576137 RepID=A0A1L7XPG3_9HELO|nr:related to potential drug facilitator PEP5 [Phialocephala subalpina]
MPTSSDEKGDLRVVNNESPEPREPLPSSVEDNDEPVPHLHAKTFLTVFAVCLIYFAQLINVVGAGARAQDISTVLGESSKSVWLTSTIAILTVVLSPPVSQAADYWGRRWFLIILTACGAVGSVIVARADSMNMAIAGEVVAGLSYGAQPLLHAVASEVLPRRYRPFAQGADNLAAALGGIAALLVGGAMTRNGNHEGFRNYWYFSTAVYLLATILCMILYNPPPQPSQLGLTNIEKLKKLDWIGYILLASGLVLFCTGLSWSQNPYAWTDAHILAPFLIGVALMTGLAIYETKFKKDGMFHHGLFSNGWNFPIALLCVFVEGLSFFAANNYFAFQVSVLYETDSLRTGARYTITFIVYATMSVLAGAFCSKTKMIRFPTVVAFGFMTVFFVCMATTTPGSSKAVWGYPALLGIGLGIGLCALVTAAQLSTPRELIAITSGLMISIRSLGGSVGLAIYNAIFTAKFTANLGPKIAEAVLPLGLPASSLPAFIGDLAAQNQTALMTVPGVSLEIIGAGVGGLFEAYSLGFRFVWVAAACFMVVATIAAFFLVDPVKEFNMHIDAPAEKEEDLFA